jgi:predicted RNA-binding protein
MGQKPVSKWIGENHIDPNSFWRSKPIPFGMLVRGYLPAFLGGEMVYDAVVRTNHFQSDYLLQFYLMEQAIAAAARGADKHLARIEAHIARVRQSIKDAKLRAKVQTATP